MLLAPDASGSLCFATSAAVHLAADVTGWVAAGRGFHPVAASRVLDARVGTTAVILRPGAHFALPTTAASMWSVRVAVVSPDGAGGVTVQACGSSTRVATLSFAARQSVAVSAIVPVNASSGAWCVTATACGTKAPPVALWYTVGRPSGTAAFVVPDTTGSVCVTVLSLIHI